ncbi:hypothetical protein [Niabella ginsengisoli]|uniref:Uncharacterized protein n=1 Tax=Niabella ginsengisoli TaxID=522298 RepID=A0ABS9SN49_9BACT|nr:hypothetical protein [Niabella ginsengisoli]MCH5599804.1 hypothetical protein [Niabella ginsengisoli]
MKISEIISQASICFHYNEDKKFNVENDKPNSMMHYSIEPLEWQENEFIAITRTALGIFKIDKYSLQIELIFGNYDQDSVFGTFESVEAAKANVQSIWEDFLKLYLKPGNQVTSG